MCCHQEVKIVLYSMWYHRTCRWPPGAQVQRRHVEEYIKLIIKQDFCALSWLITKIILRCTVSKT